MPDKDAPHVDSGTRTQVFSEANSKEAMERDASEFSEPEAKSPGYTVGHYSANALPAKPTKGPPSEEVLPFGVGRVSDIIGHPRVPSIGRIVHYWVDSMTIANRIPIPAIITRVWSPTCVNIRLLGENPDGDLVRTSVTLYSGAADAHAYTASWPERV